jgi:hypothetical protein
VYSRGEFLIVVYARLLLESLGYEVNLKFSNLASRSLFSLIGKLRGKYLSARGEGNNFVYILTLNRVKFCYSAIMLLYRL